MWAVFRKSLFEKRWGILIWFSVIAITIFGLGFLFPPLRDTMGAMMGQIPESMRGWFGNADTWSVFQNYAAQEVFGEMAMLPAALAIVFGVTLLASEEADGRILPTLARPLSRSKYFFGKWLVLALVTLLGTIALFVGIITAGAILGESFSVLDFLKCSLMTFLHALALGTLSFALGAIFARKMLGGILIGFYAFLSYFIESLSTAASIVEKLSNFALYHYIDAHGIIASGLSDKNILILAAAVVVPLMIALPIFTRRNLNTR